MNATVPALLLIGVWGLFGCSRQSAGPIAPAGEDVPQASVDELPEWSLTESDSASLGAPYKTSQWEIRPPADFRFIKYVAESKMYYWVGPVRADETYPQLIVTIAPLSGQEANAPLTTLMKGALGSIQQIREDWSETQVEQGKIDGLPFARSSWSGVATGTAREGLTGRTMHGIVYLAVHENQMIQIICQDVAPDHAEWLKQGGAAALTFRVLPAETTSP
jgi:hypothetical protein